MLDEDAQFPIMEITETIGYTYTPLPINLFHKNMYSYRLLSMFDCFIICSSLVTKREYCVYI